MSPLRKGQLGDIAGPEHVDRAGDVRLVSLNCRPARGGQHQHCQASSREHDIGFLIIDSILPALGGDPLSAEVALAFFGAIRQLGLGTLCVAHITKDGSEEMPFGSVMFHNLARSTWFVKKGQQAGENEATIGLFQKKTNLGMPALPLGLKFTWTDDRCRIQRTDVRSEPDFAQDISLGSRVLKLLDGAPATVEEMTTMLQQSDPKVKEDSVRKAVWRLKEKGLVREVGMAPNRLTQWGRAVVSVCDDLDDLPF